jgi:hypothetical protein
MFNARCSLRTPSYVSNVNDYFPLLVEIQWSDPVTLMFKNSECQPGVGTGTAPLRRGPPMGCADRF